MRDHTSAAPPTIDALSAAVKESGGALGPQTALWRAMFGLERWWFVARGTMPDLGPLVGTVDDVPCLLAFTTGNRAREFALANGFTQEQAEQVLAVPSGNILDLCDQLAAHGVERVVVDHGTTGFFAPIGQLRPIHDYVESHPTA